MENIADFTCASPVISVTSFSGGGDKSTGREGITVSTRREQNTSLRCQGGCECEGKERLEEARKERPRIAWLRLCGKPRGTTRAFWEGEAWPPGLY